MKKAKDVIKELKKRHSHNGVKIILFPEESLLQEGIDIAILSIKKQQDKKVEELKKAINKDRNDLTGHICYPSFVKGLIKQIFNKK